MIRRTRIPILAAKVDSYDGLFGHSHGEPLVNFHWLKNVCCIPPFGFKGGCITTGNLYILPGGEKANGRQNVDPRVINPLILIGGVSNSVLVGIQTTFGGVFTPLKGQDLLRSGVNNIDLTGPRTKGRELMALLALVLPPFA